MPAVTFPPYRERKTGSQRRRPGPRRVTLIQLDTSLNLREKRPGFPLAEAGHPFAQAGLRRLVERVPLFDGHIGGQQRSMRPAHMSRLAASPLADTAKPPKSENVRDKHGSCRVMC